MSQQEQMEQLIAQFQDPAQALVALAEFANIAIAYVDRSGFESQIGHALTDEEWEDVGIILAGTTLDEWLFDQDIEGLQREFVEHIADKAGLEIGGGD